MNNLKHLARQLGDLRSLISETYGQDIAARLGRVAKEIDPKYRRELEKAAKMDADIQAGIEKGKLSKKVKSKAHDEIYKILDTGEGAYLKSPELAFNLIRGVLEKYSIGTEEARFSGDSGSATIDLFYFIPSDFEGEARVVPISDSMLVLSWYKMPSGRYEITTYLS